MSGRAKVELEIDPAKVVPMNGEAITFGSHHGDYGPNGSRLVVYVVEDLDGGDAEVVFVGHTQRGDSLIIQRRDGP